MEKYRKRLEEIENEFSDNKQLFKAILKFKNELKAEIEIAEFERSEDKVKLINDFLNSLLFITEKQNEEDGEFVEVFNYVPLYNKMTNKQKQKICDYFYEYSDLIKNRKQDILKFKNNIVFSDYSKLVLLSLFYL